MYQGMRMAGVAEGNVGSGSFATDEYAPWLFAARLPSSIDALDQNILQSLLAIIFNRLFEKSIAVTGRRAALAAATDQGALTD
jgi:hypothetical protein